MFWLFCVAGTFWGIGGARVWEEVKTWRYWGSTVSVLSAVICRHLYPKQMYYKTKPNHVQITVK